MKLFKSILRFFFFGIPNFIFMALWLTALIVFYTIIPPFYLVFKLYDWLDDRTPKEKWDAAKW